MILTCIVSKTFGDYRFLHGIHIDMVTHRGGTEAEGKFSDGDIVLAIDGELVATATDVEASVQV